jgi:hypothetical protein
MATDPVTNGNDADEVTRLRAEVERLSGELAACREDDAAARAEQQTTAEIQPAGDLDLKGFRDPVPTFDVLGLRVSAPAP